MTQHIEGLINHDDKSRLSEVPVSIFVFQVRTSTLSNKGLWLTVLSAD